ncbi:MAG: hypothetical protein HEP71_05790 [Roseivirga sp.]|nr:hypothetical protein [Roseivirga sp.]
MKKSLLLTVLLCFITLELIGQDSSLLHFNTERLQVNKTGMLVLGGWAVGNIGINAFLTRNASGSDAHFYRMNIYWNMVNLALAIPGLRNSIITDPASLDLAESVSAYHHMGKILLINAGLDVAYITGGFLLKEMAKTRENKFDILNGYGRSLILQGGFLLAFDLVLYAALQSKSDNLTKILEAVKLTPTGIGLTFTF